MVSFSSEKWSTLPYLHRLHPAPAAAMIGSCTRPKGEVGVLPEESGMQGASGLPPQLAYPMAP